MNELYLQAQCSQWFWNNFPKERGMLHNNDNNSYNRIEGARKKAIGVVKGVSDFELITFEKVWFIEFKLPGGKLSDEQKLFMDNVIVRGHEYRIIYSFEEFKLLIYGALGNT